MEPDAFFDAVPQRPHATRNGSCELPIRYLDASQFGVFFRVDLDRARAVIGASRSVEPWPILGKAVAAVYVWEYRDSTVGAYGEVGLGVQARRKGSRPSLLKLVADMGAQDDQGIWVVDLPVTTRAAFEAGVDLWGYPKYVTPIETEFSSHGASVRLGDELSMSIGRLRGPRLRGQPVVTYTASAGRLLRTRIDVDHHARWGSARSARLEVFGDGPLADSARRLGLVDAPAVAAFRVDRFRARLPAGVELGSAE
ncbi:MAG: acetoacetate decarboxylase family protein [Myxococcales bacterium]|nr:acetoacetate decarboxylase family protein [Myxococcales bacterium]